MTLYSTFFSTTESMHDDSHPFRSVSAIVFRLGEEKRMTKIATRLTHLVPQVLFLLAFAIGLPPAPTSAQTTDTRALLQQYQAAIAKVSEAAARQLGPYSISTRCTYCTYAWGKLCWTEATQTIGFQKPVDFSWTRGQLRNLLQQAGQNAGAFSASFAPTQAWIDRLPEFKSQFNGSADRVLAVQKEIAAGNGPTDQQRQQVADALQNLTGLLNNSSDQLQKGTAALAAFLQQQSQSRQWIAQAITGADQSAQQELTALRNSAAANAHPDCLNNLINNNFNPIKSQVSSSLQEISQAFQNLETSSRAADRAVADWLGFVISNQTDIKSVSDIVSAAKADQIGGFLQRLHLDAAKNRLAALSAGVR
jgi:hypothetical protein